MMYSASTLALTAGVALIVGGVWLIWHHRKSSDAPLPHAPWHESASAQSSKIDRYYQLHQQFGDYSLAALHAVVNEFKEA